MKGKVTVLAPILALAACALAGLLFWKLHNLQDNIEDEPVLTEHAKVHAKSEHGRLNRRLMGIPAAKYIHFYVPERDTVVVCQVTDGIWHYLPKNDWGMLHHQGGKYFSFRRDCDGELVEPRDYSTIYDIYRGGK